MALGCIPSASPPAPACARKGTGALFSSDSPPFSPHRAAFAAGCAVGIWLLQAESFDNINVAVLPSAATSESQAYDFLHQLFLNLLDNCSCRVFEFRCDKNLQKQMLPSMSVNAHQPFTFMKSKNQHSDPQSFRARRYETHTLTVQRLAVWPLPSTYMLLVFLEIRTLFYKMTFHFHRQSLPKKRWCQGMYTSCNSLDMDSVVLFGL